MKQFATGTKEQFDYLKASLDALAPDTMEVYDCILPPGCTPEKSRIGFEKREEAYYIYLDKKDPIISRWRHPALDLLITEGTLRFLDFEDLAEYFHSLAPMWEDTQNTKVDPKSQMGGTPSRKSVDDIVDIEGIERLEAEKTTVIYPEQIEEILNRDIYGQKLAIKKIAEFVSMSTIRKQSKILKIFVMGPTAVGKSETFRKLAAALTELTGIEYGFIELSGGEYTAEHDVAKILGAPPGYVGHGEEGKLAPVRENPYHVIVINEIDKAHKMLCVALMEAIDTGKLGMADSSPDLDLNKCILVFTSNTPINMEKYAKKSAFEQEEMCRDAFTKHCQRPEISGKIGNFVAYQPLSRDAQIRIVVKAVQEELEEYDLILDKIATPLQSEFLDYASQTKYGARAIRGMVQQSVGAYLIRNRHLLDGTARMVRLNGTADNLQLEFVTEEVQGNTTKGGSKFE